MKRLLLPSALLLLALTGACHRSLGAGNSTPGAATPRAAVERFLGAVRGQDLQAMSAVWGTDKGPIRDQKRLSAEDLEKRELLMQCYLNHDAAEILGETAVPKNGRAFTVELRQKSLTRRTTFTTVKGPSERWYVLEADISPLSEFCRNGGAMR